MARLSSGDNLARLGRFGKSTSFVLETNECVIEAGRDMLLARSCTARGETVVLSPSGGQQAVATSAESHSFAVKGNQDAPKAFARVLP
jgi:hypothetical protein